MIVAMQPIIGSLKELFSNTKVKLATQGQEFSTTSENCFLLGGVKECIDPQSKDQTIKNIHHDKNKD